MPLGNGGEVVIGEDDDLHRVFLFDDAGDLRGAVKFVGDQTFLFGDNAVVVDVSANFVGASSMFAGDLSAESITATVITPDKINAKMVDVEALDPLILERFAVSVGETVEPGNVVCIDPLDVGSVKKCAISGDPKLVGVVSPDATVDSNGEILVVIPGAHGPLRTDGTRLEVLVKAAGEIGVGDRLISSTNPWHVKSGTGDPPGALLGKALEGQPGGFGLIRVLASLG